MNPFLWVSDLCDPIFQSLQGEKDSASDTHTQIHLAKWVIHTSLVRFSAVVGVIAKVVEEVRSKK